MLGLPDGITACLFDLDGVITKTAVVHKKAWKQTFDTYLKDRYGDDFDEFTDSDYDKYVDGMRREDGVATFLKSRGIEPEADLVERLATDKNDRVLKLIETDGVEAYDGTVRYLDAVAKTDLKVAVVSSSANTEAILETTGLRDRFETIVDGNVAKQRDLPGKPKPDTFLEGARELGVEAKQAAVFEDAQSGVQAGRAGDFGYVIGVDRVGQREALLEHGADVVVDDLAELL
jgi:beta-phosphoglucomutase family hydrolase